MSIWCSQDHIGTETWEGYEVAPGLVSIDLGDGKARASAEADGHRRVEHRAERGEVRADREGFSNHHPDDSDAPASVSLAHIAPWCVPGHNQDGDGFACTLCGVAHDHPECGPWVRLDVDADGAMTWWGADAPQPAPVHASVVLDVEAARSLAADLLEWAARPHLEPVRREEETDA